VAWRRRVREIEPGVEQRRCPGTDTPWERVGRTVVAIVAVGGAKVAFGALGVRTAGLVSDLQRFEDSCIEMDSILCASKVPSVERWPVSRSGSV
jgi:hypothetical protein